MTKKMARYKADGTLLISQLRPGFSGAITFCELGITSHDPDNAESLRAFVADLANLLNERADRIERAEEPPTPEAARPPQPPSNQAIVDQVIKRLKECGIRPSTCQDASHPLYWDLETFPDAIRNRLGGNISGTIKYRDEKAAWVYLGFAISLAILAGWKPVTDTWEPANASPASDAAWHWIVGNRRTARNFGGEDGHYYFLRDRKLSDPHSIPPEVYDEIDLRKFPTLQQALIELAHAVDQAVAKGWKPESLPEEPELKPCPFCGSTDIRIEGFGYGHCDDCGTFGPDGNNDLSVADAWNKRSQS